jgi:F-type H+-transporting ATPase subunit epsilon
MSFRLEIITPSSSITKAADSLRAQDSSGFFGVLSRHQDFMTVLKPCILMYREGGMDGFVALDGGILRVESGQVTVASREAVEGKDLSELREALESVFYRKAAKEAAFMDLLSNMEKLLVDNIIKFEKG